MLKSSAFENNGAIPKKYTIDGDKVSPPLVWSDLTPETKSYALLMEDLDVPEAMGGVFIHWMVYDIPEGVRAFEEGKLPEGAKYVPNTYAQWGMKDFENYGPPWPPASHRYKFTLYALGVENLGVVADYEDFMKAVRDNQIVALSLIGIYGPAETPLPG